ncbi:MAG: T9SS type A sorting domain-containing protein, partial [Balneolales bacterium]
GNIEIEQEMFCIPPDVDGSGKVKVMLVNIQDGWDEEEGGGYIAGFFDPVDLTTQENSNEAAMIYINTKPGIYTDDRPANSQSSLSTVAHEYQHLIHANYGMLNLFQNEGQSQLAEILNGYDATPMAFLNQPEEVSGTVSSGGLFRWRTGDSVGVLYDYERAGLLHSYLSERVGPAEAGRLTRSQTSGRAGYESVLDNLGWHDFLAGFYVANWVNDREMEKQYRYDMPQFRNIRVSNPGLSFNSSLEDSWVHNQEVELSYGGAHYTNWFGVKDMHLKVEQAEDIRHYVAFRLQGETVYTVEYLEGSQMDLEDIYDSITLISVYTGSDGGESGDRTFRLTSDWERTNLAEKEYRYYSEDGVHFYVVLADGDSEAGALSLRFTPEEAGNLKNVGLTINSRAQGITGDGNLKLTLSDSRVAGQGETSEFRVPDNELATMEVPFSNLAQGMNFINVDADAASWQVNTNQDYHITFEITEGSPDAQLELLIDAGTCKEFDNDMECIEYQYDDPEDEEYDTYTPVRTIGSVDGLEADPVWFHYPEHNNLLVSLNLIYPDESLEDQNGSDLPYADSFELEQNYPNPFNPVTVIRYNLVEEVPVRLEVFDILGRKVETLVDEPGQRVGSYDVRFDGGGLASGIYLYRLQAGDYTQTGKMTLTK